MKLFIPTQSDSQQSLVSENLGRAPFFYLYDTKTGKGMFYKNQFMIENQGAGVKTAAFILNKKSDVLITPRVGEKALDLLLDTDVKIFQSDGKSIQEVIEDFSNDELEKLY